MTEPALSFDGVVLDGTWPEPQPLGVTRAPEWPRGVLPPWAEAMVDGVADELQAPRDLPAMLLLGALAVLHGGRSAVRIKGQWSEGLNLYVVVALPPSVGKSPAMSMIFAPLKEWLDDRRQGALVEVERAKQQLRMIEQDMAKAEKAGNTALAGHLLDYKLALEMPVVPQLWTDDATPEAFVRRLYEHGGRMSIMSTEGGVFQIMAGRYGEMSNLEPYLKAWSGDEIVVDRIGRESYIVPNPTTSMVLTVQPSVLEEVGQNRENRNRGLPARFMMSIPEHRVGHRNMIDAPELGDDVRWKYHEEMWAIMRRLDSIGSSMRPTPSAQRGFLFWRQSLEDRRAGDLKPLSEWSTKLESSVVRTAGLLHFANGNSTEDPISDETMAAAIVIGNYWIEHAKLAHDMWDADSALSGARAIVARMVDDEIEETTARDLMRLMRQRFGRADDLVPSLELLVDRGWIRSDDPDGEVRASKRGERSPNLRLHPAARNLWISIPHVTFVTHVPKDVIPSSLSLSL